MQSIERAFAILRALSIQPYGVTELAEQVELPKSTVARLLSALESEGAITQVDVGGEYSLGSAIEDLAGAIQGSSLIAAARPFLVALSEQTGEASGIDTLEDGWVLFADQVAAENDIQVRDWTGEWGQAHTIPSGLAMLAHVEDDVLNDYIEQGLDAATPNTLTSGEVLRERLTQVRSAGYIWCFEEFADGINSVAAPVFDSSGVVAALHVHGPTYRFPNPNFTHDVGLVVSEAATTLSEQLQAYAE